MNTELSTAQYFTSSQNDDDRTQLNPPRKKGGWNRYLTIICVLFALSSIIGALSAARGVYGLSQPVEKPGVARTAAERELQKITKSRTDAINKYFPILIYNEIVKLVVAASLMFAAVYLVSQAPKARSFAIGVCFIALFYHVSSLIVSILMISETGGVINSMLADTMNQLQFQSEKQKQAATNYLQNSLINYVTIAVAIGFLIKLVFYGTILAYFWSDDVKKIFGEDPLAYMEKEAAEKAAKSGMPQTA